jgi:hypothetical protein
MVRKFVLFFLLLLSASLVSAQVNANDSVVSAFIPAFNYSLQFPGGDVAEQYGLNSTIGGSLMVKSKKNFLYSFNMGFIFGNQVYNGDSILKWVMTGDGNIIDGNGLYAAYSLYERGYSLSFNVGKILPVLAVNPNSGLMLSAGLGYLAHRMVIEVQDKTAPQVGGDYAKGYDHLTTGFALNQFIGYFYMGNSRVLNFYAGFEIYEAFTKNRRNYNFDTMMKDESSHTDFFYGFRIGWMIPIYDRAPDAYYYY